MLRREVVRSAEDKKRVCDLELRSDGHIYMVLCQDLAQNKMRSSATKLLTENRPSHTFFRSR